MGSARKDDMSTAQEVSVKAAEVDKKYKALRDHMALNLSETMLLHLHGREVGAKRARKLRKRGDIVRFADRTRTGKSRYRWIRRLNVVTPNN